MSSQPIIPTLSHYRNFDDFLVKHTVQRDNPNKSSLITNTRIPCPNSNIYGGSYNIPDAEYQTFMQLYRRDVLLKNKKEYMTEKQIPNGGPLLVDIDIRHELSVDERQYTREHVDELIDMYMEELSNIYQFNNDVQFYIYVYEKPTVNRVEDKGYTKDGIHVVFNFQSTTAINMYLRDRAIACIKENDAWCELPITNTWDEVFDEGIAKGTVNWQLHGSRKPNHDRYRLVRIFNITVDDGEIVTSEVTPKEFNADSEDNIGRMSIRYKHNPVLMMKTDFIPTFNQYKDKLGLNSAGTNNNVATVVSNSLPKQYQLDLIDNPAIMNRIKSKDELEIILNAFLDYNTDLNRYEYDVKNAHDYAMILPESYYGIGSYTRWIELGWALKNTSNRLLIVWLSVSAKSPNFKYSQISDLVDRWLGFDVRSTGGLTLQSITYWARRDAPDAFKKVRDQSIEHHIENILSSGGPNDRIPDYDIATILSSIFKGEFMCASIKSNVWYHYYNGRWCIDDSGTTLRKHISTTVRELFGKKTVEGMASLANISRSMNVDVVKKTNEDLKEEKFKNRSIKVLNLTTRLANTADKKNIMQEAKDIFYDKEFVLNLDQNPYLLGMQNGVIDFKTKCFRKGKPEDYISLNTNITYAPVDPVKDSQTVDEIKQFMQQLFPIKELERYMWEHLASTLIGTSQNQTFNMYLGVGQNGKSILTNLMERVLGDYKCDVPTTLITEKRAKVGGLTPEIVGMKGRRYAVMQEPSKGEVINEGVMKQLTSGKDAVQARSPYMLEPVTFLPQFKLVVASNHPFVIKANDHGTWRRIRNVPFMSLFTDDPQTGDKEKPYQYKVDRTLDEKFDGWAPVFLSMLVDIAFKTNGFVTDCDVVLAHSKEYRKSQDYISEFIGERIKREKGGTIKKMELNNEFSLWYNSNQGGKGPSPRDLHECMDKEFGKHRGSVWHGVKITYGDSENDSDSDDGEGDTDSVSNISMDDL